MDDYIDKLIESIIGGRVEGTDYDLIETYGVDSMMMMQIIVEIEKEFDIEIPDEFLDLDFLRYKHNLVKIIQETNR